MHGVSGQESFLLVVQIYTRNTDHGEPLGLERNITAALPWCGFIGRSKRTEETENAQGVASRSLAFPSLAVCLVMCTLCTQITNEADFFFFFIIFIFLGAE